MSAKSRNATPASSTEEARQVLAELRQEINAAKEWQRELRAFLPTFKGTVDQQIEEYINGRLKEHYEDVDKALKESDENLSAQLLDRIDKLKKHFDDRPTGRGNVTIKEMVVMLVHFAVIHGRIEASGNPGEATLAAIQSISFLATDVAMFITNGGKIADGVADAIANGRFDEIRVIPSPLGPGSEAGPHGRGRRNMVGNANQGRTLRLGHLEQAPERGA